MMRQQVNLYQDLLQDKVDRLSAKRWCVILIGACLVTLLFNGYSHYERYQLAAALSSIQAEVSSYEEKVIELGKQVNTVVDPHLTRQLNDLQRELEHLNRVKDLAEMSLQSTYPNTLLRAYARQLPEGMWLASLHMGNYGYDVVLEGFARTPELVPTYLKNLRNEIALSGLTFHTVEILPLDTVVHPSENIPEGVSRFRLVAGCLTRDCGLTGVNQ